MTEPWGSLRIDVVDDEDSRLPPGIELQRDVLQTGKLAPAPRATYLGSRRSTSAHDTSATRVFVMARTAFIVPKKRERWAGDIKAQEWDFRFWAPSDVYRRCSTLPKMITQKA